MLLPPVTPHLMLAAIVHLPAVFQSRESGQPGSTVGTWDRLLDIAYSNHAFMFSTA
jgi:hypothetical protein